MKKFFAFIATAFMAISASAQSEAGSLTWKPNVGITYSTATSDAGKGVDGAIGLTAGVEAMYMCSEQFGVALGLNYTGYNVCGSYYKKEDAIASNYYFNIPVVANYYVAPGLALKAGIAINLLSTAKIDGDSELMGIKFKDLYKSNFFSVPVGASYEINDFVFDARYNFGISKAYEVADGSFNALTFTVGYKF